MQPNGSNNIVYLVLISSFPTTVAVKSALRFFNRGSNGVNNYINSTILP